MAEGAGEKLNMFVVYGLLFCLAFDVWCYVYHFSAMSPERDVAQLDAYDGVFTNMDFLCLCCCFHQQRF